jgi:hypothetical protein
MHTDMKYFEFDHLPPHLQAVSQPFHWLAWKTWGLMGRGADPDQVEKALDKLLEAKDAAVRSALALESELGAGGSEQEGTATQEA